jgi:hypothetical protein
MSNQSDKILLGTTQSSFKSVDNVPGTISAGKIVRSKSDGTYSIAAADGSPVGISLGKDLSDIGRTAVCRRGTLVPMVLTAAFDPAIGTQVHISDTTGLAIAAGAGATGMNATYATGRVGGTGVNNGLDESGTYVGVALIDFPGGL